MFVKNQKMKPCIMYNNNEPLDCVKIFEGTMSIVSEYVLCNLILNETCKSKGNIYRKRECFM